MDLPKLPDRVAKLVKIGSIRIDVQAIQREKGP